MLEKYKQSSPKSRKVWERALNIFPGGTSHNLRTFGLNRIQAYPSFMQRGEGSHIWDIDGNEYIDYWLTHLSLLLGHNYPPTKEAVQKQLANGWHLGALSEQEVILGEMLQEAIPQLKRMRFCSTGNEATMYAVRLARLFTGKQLVAKIRGGWHGGNDSLNYHIQYPFSDEPFFNGVSFEFNNRESVDAMLNTHGKDLAAIIIEPIPGAGGGLVPELEFLPYLREQTEARDILLIFDEIMTGFRLCYGASAKTVFGVEPDLYTLGKIIAGGMPVGVYGGREDVMEFAAPDTPGSRWVGGGTFSCHLLTMTAGIATLKALQPYKDKYSELNQQGGQLRQEINTLFEEAKINAIAVGTGSIIFIHLLTKSIEGPPYTVTQIAHVLDQTRNDLFQGKLMEEGIFGINGLGGLSFAHTDKDIEKTLEAIQRIISILSG